jgi:hypothetical protein
LLIPDRAHDEKLVRRVGKRRRKVPRRYRLENEDDKYFECGELPRLWGLKGVDWVK